MMRNRPHAGPWVVALSVRMLDLHKKLHQHQIKATDAEIDALLYELQGLTEEEIAIAEEPP